MTKLVRTAALSAAVALLGLAPHLRPAATAVSRRGMVSAATPEASDAGAEILRAGGNAVDAAVATALALAVTYPQAGNLAGGSFLVIRTAKGELHALDCRETAPAATFDRTFVRPDGTVTPGASTDSGLAVGTPGAVRGLEEAHRKLGRLPWARLVAPAIRLARDGFVVPGNLTRSLSEEAKLLRLHPESWKRFFPGGEPLAPGTKLTQPELAETLDAIARGGADAFHRGPIAERIASFVRSEGGVLTAHDLAAYRPVWRTPVVIDFEGWQLVTMPLPSSGGFLLTSILGQLGAARGDYRSLDARGLHVVAEAERRAFADRNRDLGDGDCVDVPLARLLDPARLRALGASIDPARATVSSSLPAPRPEREETTHLSVALANGEAVALTTTLNGSFGNGSVVPGVGVLLNNEMDDFAVAPGHPNLYGLIQGESNAVLAGARPLSSMTPTIVLANGRPRFVIGSPGGSTIPTTVLQVFLNAGPRGMPLDEAVAAPRLHHQHLPDRIDVEKGVPAALRLELEALGHQVKERAAIGLVHAIAWRADGTLLGVADPRGAGRPAGVP